MVAFAIVYGASESFEDPYAYDDPYGGYGGYGDEGYATGYDPYEPALVGGYIDEPPATIHPLTGARWSEESSYSMGWYEGLAHCATLSGGGWRMPTRAEVESLVDPSVGGASVPLHEPFRSATRGSYLWSGEEVPGRPGHPWIMNLANGHVFNGHGYEGVVRCVQP
jgi:hypothetical protein